jgi:peptidyl-prolyl cis-trans isomerase D
VKPEETGPFNAGTAPNVPRVGPAAELFADALKANAGQLLAKVYETPGGPVVARVKERQRPDPSKFAERKPEVEARLRLQREAEMERAWVDDLRKRAKVQPNQEFVMGTAQATPVLLD